MPINNIKNAGEVMYMKIAELGNKNVQNTDNIEKKQIRAQERVRTRTRAQVNNQAASQEVRAEFSTRKMVEAAVKQAAQMPEVREEKVAQLREQIQQGTYQVSNRQIARAMIGGLLNEIA